jgi:radical SAM protein with 4Fe4S-binding SPASM domain
MRQKTITEKMAATAKDLATSLYYQKYFEWGLPTRRFAQVNIETNSNCTRNCHFCMFGIKEEVPSVRMQTDLCFRIIDELASLNFVGRFSLFNINEPLTDKRIYSFVQYAALMLPGCYHVLVTNGDLLTSEKIDALLNPGLDQLFINSYDEDARLRNTSLDEYARGAHPGKVTHVDRTQYTEWVSRAGHVKQYAKPPVAGYCDWPNYALYVKPDGRVLACCHDFDGINLVGNLTEQSVEEVWFGKAFSDLRRRLNQGDRSVSTLCSRCDHKPNLEYFRSNHLSPFVNGKSGWARRPRPSRKARVHAQAIKEALVARGDRMREYGNPSRGGD